MRGTRLRKSGEADALVRWFFMALTRTGLRIQSWVTRNSTRKSVDLYIILYYIIVYYSVFILFSLEFYASFMPACAKDQENEIDWSGRWQSWLCWDPGSCWRLVAV